MSMNVGSNYSGYPAGCTETKVGSADDSKLSSVVDIRKEQERLKPELDAWKKHCEELRGGPANYETGVIYDRSGEKVDNSTYSINKMNKVDRAAIAEQLKAATEQYTGTKIKDKFLTEIDLLWNTKRQRWNQS